MTQWVRIVITNPMTLDPNAALSALGNPWTKPWQQIIFHWIGLLLGVVASWSMLGIVFIGGDQNIHRCRLPEGIAWNNVSIPYNHERGELDRCHVFKDFDHSTGVVIPCPGGYVYDEGQANGIIQEWDLVCDRGYLSETTQSILVFGVLIGAFFMTQASDRYGRKPVFIINAVLVNVMLFASGFAPTLVVFNVLRFFTGIFQQGAMLSGYVLACETFPAKQRTMAGMMFMMYWPLGMVSLAGFAYLIRDWRTFIMFTSLPVFFVIPVIWLVSESVPWLIAKKRIEDAKLVLMKAAKWNHVELPDIYQTTRPGLNTKKSESLLSDPEFIGHHDTDHYNFMDIFRYKKLRQNALIMIYLWFVVCLVYYGLSLSSVSLSGNKYLNFALSGAVEAPAYVIFAVMIKKSGRRWPLCIFLISSGISLIMTMLIPDSVSYAKVFFNMVGKFFISAAFCGVFLYAPELFPTTLRNAGLGLGSLGGRVGNMIAPYTTYFERIAPWAPGIVFGVVSILGGLATLLLPETQGRPLPQTIEEVENWKKLIKEPNNNDSSMKKIEDRNI